MKLSRRSLARLILGAPVAAAVMAAPLQTLFGIRSAAAAEQAAEKAKPEPPPEPEPTPLARFLAREDEGAGAESVTEGVHADSSLSLGSLGAGRLLRVASISLELFECCHIVILTNKAKIEVGP